MAATYLHTMFGSRVRALQEAAGSRAANARMGTNADDLDVLGTREAELVSACNSFYMASVNGDGWSYVLRRDGSARFSGGSRATASALRAIAAADATIDRRFRIQRSHFAVPPGLSQPRRLKGTGHAHGSEDPAGIAAPMVRDYPAEPDCVFLIDVIGSDWNCPQHGTHSSSKLISTTTPSPCLMESSICVPA
jgi:hypothetical protein